MNTTTPSTPDKHIKILLFSRFRIVQQSVKLLIESSRGLAVKCSTVPLDEIGRKDCVLDSEIAVVHFLADDRRELISDLLKKKPELRIIVLADGLDIETQAQLFKLGAFGIVQKEQGLDPLIDAIRRIHVGETWLNLALLNKILETGKPNSRKAKKGFRVENGESLTSRELEIIRIIGEGLKNKEIGERLNISEATVRHHLSSIYAKIGVEDRLNLVIFAYERGLIKMNDDWVEPLD